MATAVEKSTHKIIRVAREAAEENGLNYPELVRAVTGALTSINQTHIDRQRSNTEN